jgi:quercetin dioxygenase-like cupin family protein
MADVGTKLLFENERVKVWEFTLQPGQAIGLHTHTHDYLILPIETSTVQVTRPGQPVEVRDYAAGTVIWRDKGETHDAKNVGVHRYHQLLVELKSPAAGAAIRSESAI